MKGRVGGLGLAGPGGNGEPLKVATGGCQELHVPQSPGCWVENGWGRQQGGRFCVQRKMVVARLGVALEVGERAGLKALTGEHGQDPPRETSLGRSAGSCGDWDEQGLGTPRATWLGPPLLLG